MKGHDFEKSGLREGRSGIVRSVLYRARLTKALIRKSYRDTTGRGVGGLPN